MRKIPEDRRSLGCFTENHTTDFWSKMPRTLKTALDYVEAVPSQQFRAFKHRGLPDPWGGGRFPRYGWPPEVGVSRAGRGSSEMVAEQVCVLDVPGKDLVSPIVHLCAQVSARDERCWPVDPTQVAPTVG